MNNVLLLNIVNRRRLRKTAFRFLAQLRGKITQRPLIAVASVFVGTFMTSLHTRFISQGLADLRGVYSLTFDEGAWLNTALNAPQLILAPVIPFLVMVLGTRRILIVGSILFAIISFLTPYAQSYTGVLIMHGLNGLLLGIFISTTLMTVFRNLNPGWWIFALSVHSLRLVVSINLGTSLTGLYIEYFDWKWLYWQGTLLSLIMTILVWFSIPREPIQLSMLKGADWGGMFLFCIALTLIYAGIDNGNRLDWLNSGIITALIFSGCFLLLLFFIHEMIVPNPWAPLTAFNSRNLIIIYLIMLMYGAFSMSNALLIPSFLNIVQQLKSEQSGDILIWVLIPQIVLVPLSIYIIRRINAWYTLFGGLMCFALSCFLAQFLTNEWVFENFLAISVLMAGGHAFTLLSIMVLIVANMNQSAILAVLAYIQVNRILGVALGSAFLTTFLRVREHTHSFNISHHIQSGISAVETRLHGYENDEAGIASLYSLAVREAHVMSYIDAFQLCFVVIILTMLLAALMKSSPPNPLTPGTF